MFVCACESANEQEAVVVLAAGKEALDDQDLMQWMCVRVCLCTSVNENEQATIVLLAAGEEALDGQELM